METEERIINTQIERIPKITQCRTIIVLISSISNKINIHASIKGESNTIIKNNEIANSDIDDISQNWEVIDINKITCKLSSSEIKRLTLESFIQEADSSMEVDWMDSQDGADSIENSLEYDELNEFSFGLQERTKNQKLSGDQLKFLKHQIEDSSLKINQISTKFKVSPSLLYKIRRMNWERLNNPSSNNIVKIYGLQQQILVNEARNFVIEHWYPFSAKDLNDKIN